MSIGTQTRLNILGVVSCGFQAKIERLACAQVKTYSVEALLLGKPFGLQDRSFYSQLRATQNSISIGSCMLSRLQNAIISKLMRRSFKDENETYCFLVSLTVNIFALAIHSFMLCIFLFSTQSIAIADLRVTYLFIFMNICGMIFYSATFFLINSRKFVAFGILTLIELNVYAAIYCFCTGLSTYGIMYFLFITIIQVTVPYGSWRIRVTGAVLTLSLVVSCVIANFFIEPVFSFEQSLEHALLTVNVIVFLLVIVLELSIGNLMKIVAKNFNDAKMKELYSQSYTDHLTGLYNRRFAKKCFDDLVKMQIDCCVAMIDIDDFKLINDTYGHNCGDEVLCFLSEFLRKNLRSTDTVFRWGGEEFLVTLLDVEADRAWHILDKIREYVSQETIMTKQGKIKITVTVGISPLLKNNVDGSIECCDKKMYEGKRSGKNKVMR